jgi:transcriptional regulator with XRE-family HTH domain
MSSLLGISNSYLSEIENNKKQPSLDLLNSYAKIYGIKLSSLILLAESFEEASSHNKAQELVKKTMLRLIDLMSKGEEKLDELLEDDDKKI